MVYFKKYDPRIQLATGKGVIIPFEDVGGQWGLLATTNNYLIDELRRAQGEQRGGVMEITLAEFDELKKKENQKPFSIWREQVGHLRLKRILRDVGARAAAAGRSLPFAPTGFSEAKALARPVVQSDYVPRAVNR